MPTYTRTTVASLGSSKAGLAGTLGYTVKDTADATLIARTTTGVAELGTGTGIYRANVAGWDAAWAGRIEWDTTAGTALAVSSFVPYALQIAMPFIGYGVSLGGGTATTFTITGAGLNATTDAYKGHQISWQSGGLATERRSITAHTVSGTGPTAVHTITVGSPFTAAPAGGDLCTLP